MLQDGVYEESVDDAHEIASLVASAAPARPPKDWFVDPGLQKPTPLTVEKDGRIYGHIATWDTNHIGMPSETKPPRSNYDYAFFKTGVVETAEGDDVPVGQLTLAGGHAPLNASAGEAVAHYDDTASSVADLAAGEDGVGIWVSGALRPTVSDDQIRALRASAPSGDWRPINGNLELVAVCQVNTPGFPVARALAASGAITALVAAGAREMYELQNVQQLEAHVASLGARVDELEATIAAAPPFTKKKNDMAGKDEAKQPKDRKPDEVEDTPAEEATESPAQEAAEDEKSGEHEPFQRKEHAASDDAVKGDDKRAALRRKMRQLTK